MAYQIDKFDGSPLTVVQDGTINTTLDIKLVGKDYPGYGEIQNENFVFMLDNFAGTSPPPRPLNGQLWYDTTNKKVMFYDKLALRWKASSGAEVSDTTPAGQVPGDLWFDSDNQQLFVRGSSSNYLLVGPDSVTGFGTTQFRSRKIIDVDSVPHAIIEGIVDGKPVIVINQTTATIEIDLVNEPFLGALDPTVPRFHFLKSGVNLAFSDDNGVTTDVNTRFFGTATNADRLGGNLASDYVTSFSAAFPDSGFTVGSNNALHIYRDLVIGPVIENQVDNAINFKVVSGITSLTVEPLRIIDNTVLPGAGNTTVDIGGTGNEFNSVYATTFHGTADEASTVVVAGTPRSASVFTSADTLAVRDSVGSINALEFKGVATSAKFADLAEKYLTDRDYETGTVMMVGGELEVTASEKGSRAIGVISENPAFKMNSDADGQYVALKGRVPVKVFGPVVKGDELVSYNNGTAISITNPNADNMKVFAVAIESNNYAGVKLVEAVIL